MYRKKFYKTVEQEQMEEAIKQEGFRPLLIADPPGVVYPRHSHPETKLLAVLRGGMAVTVGRETYHCSVGDQLLIPGHTEHGAVVGPAGCDFFWSEKLL